jgi:hypothetical protein
MHSLAASSRDDQSSLALPQTPQVQLQHSYLDIAGRGVLTDKMSEPVPKVESPADDNPPPNGTGGAAMSAATTPQSNAPAWSANMSTFPANGSAAAGPSFPQFSASTAAILERLQGKTGGHASGSAAFEAKRAEILQNYVTSDKLPTPPPITSTGRRGRGGKVSTPTMVKAEAGASPAGASSGRGSGRGRGRGRGRGGRGGRGGKRKRSDSDEDKDVSV